MTKVEDVPTTNGDPWGRTTNHSRRVEAIQKAKCNASTDVNVRDILSLDPLNAVAQQMREALDTIQDHAEDCLAGHPYEEPEPCECGYEDIVAARIAYDALEVK